MAYTYKAETYAEIIDELKELLPLHYEEVALYQDKIDLNPAYEIYEMMNRTGNCHMYAARDEDGKLVGYSITLLQFNPHYQDHIWAMNDIIYVAKEHRNTELAPTLVQNLEQDLKALGASVMTFHMKTFKTFETLMESCGFEKQEFLFGKYIKED